MPDFHLEDALGVNTLGQWPTICGVDEAGRGPLAGPVVAAAVILRLGGAPLADDLCRGINDSKQLSTRQRERWYARLLTEAEAGRVVIAVASASVEEIDQHNILHASLLAMARAVDGLAVKGMRLAIDHALIDGNQPPPLSCALTCVVGGDGRSLSIAAASIVAKVVRDGIMGAAARQFPGYGWERNQGYPTAQHRAAIKSIGLTTLHRRSFRGCEG